jgi:NADPH-dependent ferric siderophore reductase
MVRVEGTLTTDSFPSVQAAVPLPPSVLAIAGVQPLEMRVVVAEDIGPRMRRLVLEADAIQHFEFRPGQDVMLVLSNDGDRPLSRRYTIRGVDRGRRTLEMNIVLHGDAGPGARWVSAARPGTAVNGVGPRGKIFLNPEADWHVWFADESAAPASLVMLEALPNNVPGTAFVEIADSEDQLPFQISDAHRVHWLHRGTGSPDLGRLLLDALNSFALPPGRGHLYIAGEVAMVNRLREAALRRGLSADQLSPKAYWGRGRPNASRGEPD